MTEITHQACPSSQAPHHPSIPIRGPKAKDGEAGPEQPLDFTALKTLDASGSVKIGSLKLYNVKASNLRLEFRAGDGKLEVSPLAANLYQGTASGSMSLNAAGPAVAVRQNIAGVSIGPLLKDALDKDVLEGRGNVNIDVAAQGNAVSAMKKSLQGKAALNLSRWRGEGDQYRRHLA